MDFPIKPWGPLDMAERYTLKVIEKANHDAIHLMSFGFVSQANQILDILRSHDEIDFGNPDIKKLVHFAWQASGVWPHWLPPSQDEGAGSKKDSEDPALTPSLQRKEDEIMQVDGKAFAEFVMNRHDHDFRREARQQLHKLSASSPKDKKRKGEDRSQSTEDAKAENDSVEVGNGPWEEEDLQKLLKRAKAITTFSRFPEKSDSMIIAGAVEAALDLSQTNLAEEILDIHLAKRFQPLDQDTLAKGDRKDITELKHNYKYRLTKCSSVLESPRVWKFLTEQCHKDGNSERTVQVGGWLAGRLGVTVAMVEKWLDNTLKVLEMRLTNGRKGPYSHQSIRELCTTFNDLSLERKQLGILGPMFSREDLLEDGKPSKTVLHEPVTEDMLAEFEERLAHERKGKWPKGLPSQYKEFLLITNGIYIGKDGRNNSELLCPLSETEIRNSDDPFPDLTLLPLDTGVNTVSSIVPGPDWPEIDDNVFIGAGGDEGDHCIVPRSALEKGIDYMLEGWKAADDPYEQREWRRAIRDILYIDLEGVDTVEEAKSKMQDVDFVIMQGYHWAAEVICFRYFRDLLENWIDAMWREGLEKDSDDDEDDTDNHTSNDSDNENTPTENGDGQWEGESTNSEQTGDQEPSTKKLKQ